MNLIGFTIKKINAESKQQIKEKIEITTNINISSISLEKIKLSSKDIPLKFDFDFKIDYNPNVAELLFSGSVILTFNKKESKTVMEEWKTKKINPDIQIPLFNFIITKTSLKALKIEEELNLPPHIPIPKINPDKKKDTKYTG